ncbi:MAG: hypothetical protein LBJ65_16640 [Burkholderia sp.]|jgi:hypothetical protein|uniref:hypothetical protein n=1 Tax=Burkholderia sp. TaxID=36773 RepID=UPI00282F4AC2|nr:hypothetical protein [Burkholderia sp.]MDR0243226.1 hypothetical protein [Burkholderia sp.]
MPVIESPPVSMQMVVEEGWFGKSGSKWQTGLRTLMFQYRAGSFFGNIHAPDIVMGMGRTSEEEADVVDVSPDGSYTVYSTTIDELRGGRAQPAEEVPRGASQAQTRPATESHTDSASPAATHADPVDDQDGPHYDDHLGQGDFDFDVTGLVRGIREDIESAKSPEDLDLARSAISGVPDETAKAELNALASARMRAITTAAEQAAAGKATAQTTAPAGRRPRGPINAD